LIFIDADVGGQPNCTIISTSLTTLTTDGGAIVNGTENVIIYCLCMGNNVAVAGARWFFPNGIQICTETHSTTGPNDPYFRNNVPSVLVIRKFIPPYNGTYRCGPSSSFSNAFTQGDAINLTLAGMMIIKNPNKIYILKYNFLFLIIAKIRKHYYFYQYCENFYSYYATNFDTLQSMSILLHISIIFHMAIQLSNLVHLSCVTDQI